jgi:type I restriction enzyme M protein
MKTKTAILAPVVRVLIPALTFPPVAEIAKQDFILTPGHYVGIEEPAADAEPFAEKMTRLTRELAAMFKHSHKLEGEIRQRLGGLGDEI